ncbi:MAG: macro domain-containing protein [Thermomicrobiales bacterium]
MIDQVARALVVPANQRGTLAVGLSRSVGREAAGRIERAIMTQAPLALGSVAPSEAGLLEARGVEVIVHAILREMPGAPTTLATIERTTVAMLALCEARRWRTVAFPAFGTGIGHWPLPVEAVGEVMVETIVGYLRRVDSRLEVLTFVTRDEDERETILDMIDRARLVRWQEPA